MARIKLKNTSTTQQNTVSNSRTEQNDSAKSVSYSKYKLNNQYKNKVDSYNNNPYKFSMSEQQKANINNILNREAFQYDLNQDALYQQYANQYKALGQQAMANTMGEAATLSGGFGNSYAATAGQQAYNSYLEQLNDVVPQLYAQARSDYDSEGNELYNRANLLASMDAQERANYDADRNYAYQLYKDAVDRSRKDISTQTSRSVNTSTDRQSTTSSSTGWNEQYVSSSKNTSENAVEYPEGMTEEAQKESYEKALAAAGKGSRQKVIDYAKNLGIDIDVWTADQFKYYKNHTENASKYGNSQEASQAQYFDDYSDYLTSMIEAAWEHRAG